MPRAILIFSLVIGSLLLFPSQSVAQGCGHWAEKLMESFFPKQIDEQGLREFAGASPQEYFQTVSDAHRPELIKLVQTHRSIPHVESRLQFALQKFYDVGFEHYGVRLDHEKLLIQPDMDINAFATGSMIGFNVWLLEYFLDPIAYLVNIRALPNNAYTSAQYRSVRSRFGWKNDWNSIYYVLAHEAGHNLMRHRDQQILTNVNSIFENYSHAVRNHRKDLALGRKGGAKRYIWQSLQSFFKQFDNAETKREMEAEADAVAVVLLRGAGLDPTMALTGAQRMALLFASNDPQGWQGGLTEALCSTHPDWLERIDQIQANLNCVHFMGGLCQDHIAYPVDDFLAGLRNGMAQLDEYHKETISIAERNPANSTSRYEVRVKVNPKDAQLMVDGKNADPGKLKLEVGPHILSASKEGFQTSERRIVVFPDFQPKVTVKLKRARIRR